MKISSVACLFMATSASAFVHFHAQPRAFASAPARPLFAEGETAPPAPAAAAPAVNKAKAPVSSSALVPIKEETVEFTAGILGGAAGFLVGGPVVGAITAAAANYASKMDGDVPDIVQAVSKTGIQIYNYFATLDEKYEILKKAQDSLQGTLDKLKAQETVDKEAIAKVEKALSNTKSKIEEINDEYDLVGGGLTALGVVGDLVEKTIKKAGELNEEYKLTDKAMASINSAVTKAKEASKSS
jgi:hypothetical protein